MKLSYAIPVLGALALFAAVPDTAQAKSRSSFDISIGLGHSSHGHRYGHHGYHRSHYDSGVSFRYSRGHDHHYGHSYHRYHHTPRYYAPVYRETYYYRPSPRYYYGGYDYGHTRYYRPVYRSYYSNYYCD